LENKIIGSESQGACRQDELVYDKPPVVKYEGRTESHEQLFLHATWKQQTKESTVVGGTSCCVNLEYLVTSIE
jgi:hypothetical protein